MEEDYVAIITVVWDGNMWTSRQFYQHGYNKIIHTCK
jgi:hypothetical protein